MNSTFELRDILSKLMEGMTEAKLAEAIQVPKATINRILSGRTPDPRSSTLVPIAKYFGLSLNQLLGLEKMSEEYLSQIKIQPSRTLQVPIIAWGEITGERTQVSRYISIQANTEQYNENCFATIINNNAMAPCFREGSTLIVNPDLPAQHNDYVLVKKQDNSAIFRQLMIDGNQYYLTALNPALNTIVMDATYQIIGVVVETRLSLR